MGNVWGAVSMSSLTAIYPEIVKNINLGLIFIAKNEFRRRFINFVVIYVAGSLVLILIKYFFKEEIILNRLPNINELIFILITYSQYHILNIFLIYLRTINIRPVSQTISTLLFYLLLSLILMLFNTKEIIFPIFLSCSVLNIYLVYLYVNSIK
jgi:hypothetical protein